MGIIKKLFLLYSIDKVEILEKITFTCDDEGEEV